LGVLSGHSSRKLPDGGRGQATGQLINHASNDDVAAALSTPGATTDLGADLLGTPA
jgi:hypothetical protein